MIDMKAVNVLGSRIFLFLKFYFMKVSFIKKLNRKK